MAKCSGKAERQNRSKGFVILDLTVASATEAYQGLLSATLLLPISGDLGDSNVMVTMAKSDTSLHIPEQLFLFWEFQVQGYRYYPGVPIGVTVLPGRMMSGRQVYPTPMVREARSTPTVPAGRPGVPHKHRVLFFSLSWPTDRYVAICKPLHYGTLLGSRACVHMAAAAWGSGFLNAVLHTANTFSVPLCQGNAVDQFFCEIPQILKLSCSDAYLREVGVLVVAVCLAVGCFVFIVLSYGQIFRAVLRIPSEQGQHKAFSTCLPHLAVVSLFISTGSFAYLKPPSMSSPSLDLLVAVLYSVVPPALNPLIYSMRNHEIKDALRKLITGCF
ncbi:olfactory receptor 14C36-like [Aquila chrysaetos chrysaetos]|uniref:olfactory receptor 14C36-like n=1 Tax=Aquila chrysaetos chrysaetos TaxID=223781 RepID=UPI001B7D38D0|nr:olfactory receptor 14C36-like [Aquila chrysaetos chrysaetos]